MNDQIPKPQVEMLKVIHETGIPDHHRKDLADAMDKVLEDTAHRRKILSLVQEALGQIRLDMRYLMFDLEATRRERDTAEAQLL